MSVDILDSQSGLEGTTLESEFLLKCAFKRGACDVMLTDSPVNSPKYIDSPRRRELSITQSGFLVNKAEALLDVGSSQDVSWDQQHVQYVFCVSNRIMLMFRRNQYVVFDEEDPTWRLPRLSSTLARQVFLVLWQTPQPVVGLEVSFISTLLDRDEADVLSAGQELLSCGAIFSTVDEFTWAAYET